MDNADITSLIHQALAADCQITMPDSRRVTCIAHNSNAGISCDWAHADGADKGWTE